MSLKGLDPTNDNAARVVVHQAWYVSPAIAPTYGMIGRSQGCFAVGPADIAQVLERRVPGRLLIATKF